MSYVSINNMSIYLSKHFKVVAALKKWRKDFCLGNYK